jgi:hypothetical protein
MSLEFRALMHRNFTKYFGGGLRLTLRFFRRRVLMPREKIATAAALSQGALSAMS